MKPRRERKAGLEGSNILLFKSYSFSETTRFPCVCCGGRMPVSPAPPVPWPESGGGCSISESMQAACPFLLGFVITLEGPLPVCFLTFESPSAGPELASLDVYKRGAFLLASRNHLLSQIRRCPSHQARWAAPSFAFRAPRRRPGRGGRRQGALSQASGSLALTLLLSTWRTRWMETWSIILPPHWRQCPRNWLYCTAGLLGAQSSRCPTQVKVPAEKLAGILCPEEKGTFQSPALLASLHPLALCSHPSPFSG